MSRYRDPQLQVGEKYSYLFNLGPNIWKSATIVIHYFIVDMDTVRHAATCYRLIIELTFWLLTRQDVWAITANQV